LAAAIRLDPKLYEGYYYFGLACFQEGKLEQAASLFQQASAVRPEDYQSPVLAALCYTGLGRPPHETEAAYRRALTITERHVELNPDDPRALYLGGTCLCRMGQREKGLAWGERALALDPEDAGVLYNVACQNAVEGRLDRALEILEKAVENGFGHREWIENDPDLASLRALPRFQALLHRL
jgi:tetratricopeptide (TPR) repeat protein